MLESFLLDPDLMDERTSDSSYVSSSRGDFRQRVAARDGTCVMTGTGTPYAQACHIVPHAKGHQVRSEYLWKHSESSFQAQYIINLASHRHEVLDPPLESINDTRNGILLAVQLHSPFGTSEAAFLQVS
jgi:HNH endonuclease